MAALDERARPAGLRAGALDPVGREPARHLRAREDGVVLPVGGGDRLGRAVGGLLEGERGRHLRGGDDPGDRADEPCRDVGAVERERADEPQPGRVGDVDLAEHRLRRLVRHHPRGHRGQRLDPVAAAREDEQPVAVQEQLVARRRLERSESSRRGFEPPTSTARSVPPATAKSVVAVGLDDVGLVDALLLDVRAGEVDALLGSCRAAGRLGRRGRHHVGAHAAAEAVRADEALRLPLRVAEQLAAGAERGQLRLAGGVRSRSGRGSPCGGGQDDRQRREERDASTEAHHPGYTPPPGKSSPPEV